MCRLQIREDDLTGRKIADFLCEHLENMKEITPPESVHQRNGWKPRASSTALH